MPRKGIEALAAALTAAFGDRPRLDEPLANHTTSRLGGPADIWLPVTQIDELVEVVTLARQHQVPMFMLGGGANILITDGGIRGLVIENRTRQVHLQPPQPGLDRRLLTADSGVVLPNLARRCVREGLSGFEWAVGVPGTVGGAVVNNAGAYGRDMAATLVRADLLSPDGERVWQPVAWLKYDYRTSILKWQPNLEWVVLRAELQLTPAAPEAVEARMTGFNERRKSSQPPGATMGSMFKNPPGDYAGRLIEAAGLKGYRVGQAQISPVHANFFSNLGGATSTEMIELIEIAQQVVADKFNVKLELEIEVVGESAKPTP
ncbi:MAG TPA: UDP-N-acetylmuramate dehydrogenase [Anaerolineae bacterium]|nr:UDP-N-acetylmuramate dehydrogenase [Anaerolineae bacterium]